MPSNKNKAEFKKEFIDKQNLNYNSVLIPKNSSFSFKAINPIAKQTNIIFNQSQNLRNNSFVYKPKKQNYRAASKSFSSFQAELGNETGANTSNIPHENYRNIHELDKENIEANIIMNSKLSAGKSIVISGNDIPHSHLDTACGVTFNLLASSS